jgi:enoyl-CoA hydratase
MAFFRNWETALRKLETLDAVVIAAIHSHCIGGGLQIALACDLRVARDDARFGITAVREGIVPGIGMWRVVRHAGIGRAKRLALAAELTDRILSMAWTSTRLTKKLTNMAFDTSFAEFVETYFE